MDYHEYLNKMFGLSDKLKEDISILHNKCSLEQLRKYSIIFHIFIFDLVESAVGKEMTIPFLIQTLSLYSRKYIDENNLKWLCEERVKNFRGIDDDKK